MSNREWETFWERYTTKNFMREKWQLDHPARKMVYEIARRLGDSVLDVGCGTGMDYSGFIKHGLKYTGADITPKFIILFKGFHPEADAYVRSSLALQFPDESFAVVYSGGMIQHLHPDDYPRAIREMWRVCRNALIVTTGKPFTKKNDVIQKVSKGRVYDNHYNLETFLEIVHALPHFKDVKFHRNIKPTRGGTVTIVVITKDVKT